jgi:hypothetical protein
LDLNYLYLRYGVSLQMAKNAACNSSRIAHRNLAKGYAARIADARLNGTPAPAL